MTSYSIGQTTIVDQHFSNVAPTGWSSTSSVWVFNRDETSTGHYRNVFDATKYAARFSSAATGNSIYVYIPINFVSGNTYTITFYLKRVSEVVVNTNELPNQTTLLSTETKTQSVSSSSAWYQWSFTVVSTYTGAGYFQIRAKTIYGGPTSVYLDDVSIYESTPIGLPIELLYFEASEHERYNHLTWSTASEDDNDYFNIEKTQDGVIFYNIATVNGAGNSNYQIHYEYDDYELNGNICYYRLKQTDYDGKFKYHNLISVDNRIKMRIVVKVINLYGTEVDIKTKGVLILVYEDGSVKKIFNE
jgi:hypothetical protein